MASQDEGRNRQPWAIIAEDVFSPAAAWRGHRFSVFFRGAHGELLLREREGDRWTPIRSLGVPTARIGRLKAPMPVDWPLSACATRGDRVELLARGPEGELLHGTLRGDVWDGFECIGAPQVDGAGVAIPLGLAGAPTACTREAGQMDVFAVGGTGALLHTTWNGSEFSDLESLGGLDARGGDLPIAGAISAAACGRRWMSIFARSTSGELLIKKWNGSGWSPFAPVRAPEELDPMYPTLHGLVPLSSAPVAGGGGTSRLDVFARGPAGDLLHRWWNGETWTRFESLGMPGEPPVPLSGGSLACAWGKWRLDVLARAIDGKLYNVSPIFSPRHLLNSSH